MSLIPLVRGGYGVQTNLVQIAHSNNHWCFDTQMKHLETTNPMLVLRAEGPEDPVPQQSQLAALALPSG